MKTIVCLMGPTASGKTQLAIDLVRQFPCEIISVDSAMVYRGMDIGTAKPSAAILEIAPHHLIDIRDPLEPYSAAQFREDALSLIAAITSAGKIPLLVGGTMLYFRALQQGLAELPTSNPNIRKEINAKAEELGWDVLHQKLQTIDPEAAARIHPNDTQRIQRALEVYEVSGKSLTDWQKRGQSPLADYHVLNIVISPNDRTILHERIAKRFVNMLEEGLIAEVAQLYQRDDLTIHTPAIRSVGYRQIWQYLEGKIVRDVMQESAIIATRQLAKRQLTWLRHWPTPVNWFDSEDNTSIDQVITLLRQHCKGLF